MKAGTPRSIATFRAAFMRGKNFVVIAVDNTRLADGVPTLNTDWWNYGGLTRDVSLIDVPAKYIDDYDLHLNRERTAIEGSVHVEGGATRRASACLAAGVGPQRSARVGADKRAAISLSAAGLLRCGRRSIRSSTQVHLQAAGRQPRRRDGVSHDRSARNRHPAERQAGISAWHLDPCGGSHRGGRANNDQDAATLLGWAKELGCNYVRLAHYPHDQRMTRAADRLGLMVWSEIPVYWAEQFDDPAVLAKAEQQLEEEIRRDRTRRRSCCGRLRTKRR